MKPKYHLHFRQTEIPLIFTDTIFQSGSYGDFDYRVIQQGSSIHSYLTRKGLKQTYKFGLRLINDNFSKKIVGKLEKFDQKIKAAKVPGLGKRTDNKHLLKQWKKVEKMEIELCDLYRYCEQPVLAPLEDILLKASKNNKDVLFKVLKKPNLAKNFGFSSKEERVLRLLIHLGELKFSIHKNFAAWEAATYDFFKLIAKRYSLAYSQIAVLRRSEFIKILKGQKPDIEKINKRLKGCILLPPPNKQGEWRCIVGKEFEKLKKELKKTDSGDITGTVTYPGKVRGKVMKHLSWSKSAPVPKGSVVVSGMTNPHIVPYLKNAVAIVTDEGGLTCHAAIVSRELKKPCIIGTGNATQVLNDGDLVEVDAERGVVKLIRKAKTK